MVSRWKAVAGLSVVGVSCGAYATWEARRKRGERIVIVGAGIGGLATAVALRSQGFEVDVFERAKELRPVGATLALAPNGLSALSAISEGACEKVLQSCTMPEKCVVKNLKDEVVKETAFINNKALLVAWHLVQMHLADDIPPKCIHLGHTFSKYEVDELTRKVRVYFKLADGSEKVVDAKCLIGADGVHSRVRPCMLGVEAALVFHNKVMFRAILSREDTNLLSPDSVPSSGVQFTWATPSDLDLFSFRETGPSHLSFTAIKHLPTPPENSSSSSSSSSSSLSSSQLETARKASLLNHFRAFPPSVQRIIESTPPHAIYENAVEDFEVCDRWVSGPVVLLGDAVHAMTADSGQGANMALEDAAELAAYLGRARRGKDGHGAVLKGGEGELLERTLLHWEAVRRHRVERVHQASRSLTASGNPINTPGKAEQPAHEFFSFLYSYTPSLSKRRPLYT